MIHADLSSSHISPGVADRAAEYRPEWIRLPQTGSRCRFTGLSRTTLNELTIDGPANGYRAPVKSVLIRKRGASRGIRLISFDSLMAYLNGLSQEQNVQVEEGESRDHGHEA